MKSLFSFKGRINRIHYLLVCVVSTLVAMILSPIFDDISSAAEASGNPLIFSPGFWIGAVLSIITNFGYTWIVLVAAIKRCHDIGWSAWASLLILLPILGFLILVFYPGQAASNKYGEPSI